MHISAILDPLGLLKVQFLGLFKTNIVVRFGLIRRQLVLTSLNKSRLVGTKTFFEKIFHLDPVSSPRPKMGLGAAAYYPIAPWAFRAITTSAVLQACKLKLFLNHSTS